MDPASCLRCDWEGSTTASVCPSCGAPLYRAASPAAPTAPAASEPVAERQRRSESQDRPRYLAPDEEGPRAATRRSSPFALLVGLLLVAGIWWFLRAHEVPEVAPASTPRVPTGLLVFSARGLDAGALWTFDLRSGRAGPGPELSSTVVELVSARGALPGWLGVTTRLPDGRLRASILRSEARGSAAKPILAADLIAWGPRGEKLAGVQLDGTGPCDRVLRIYRADIVRSQVERVYRQRGFCGNVTSLGQDVATAYFTWVRGSSTGIYYIGNGSPHVALGARTLLSLSPTADMVVAPPSGLGSALWWRGARQPQEYAIGRDPMVLDRVLAWTPPASGALVVGEVAGRRGLYLLDTTPGGDRVPAYVGVARDPLSATAADDGTIYVANGGRLFAYADGQLTELELPAGTPAPGDAIVWLPG